MPDARRHPHQVPPAPGGQHEEWRARCHPPQGSPASGGHVEKSVRAAVIIKVLQLPGADVKKGIHHWLHVMIQLLMPLGP